MPYSVRPARPLQDASPCGAMMSRLYSKPACQMPEPAVCYAHDVQQHGLSGRVAGDGRAAQHFDAHHLVGGNAPEDAFERLALGDRAHAVDQQIADRAGKAAPAVAAVEREARHLTHHVVGGLRIELREERRVIDRAVVGGHRGRGRRCPGRGGLRRVLGVRDLRYTHQRERRNRHPPNHVPSVRALFCRHPRGDGAPLRSILRRPLLPKGAVFDEAAALRGERLSTSMSTDALPKCLDAWATVFADERSRGATNAHPDTTAASTRYAEGHGRYGANWAISTRTAQTEKGRLVLFVCGSDQHSSMRSGREGRRAAPQKQNAAEA